MCVNRFLTLFLILLFEFSLVYLWIRAGKIESSGLSISIGMISSKSVCVFTFTGGSWIFLDL